jgi:hypothetical protein
MTQLQAHASGAKADGWPPSAIVLASAAILLIGTGLYFLFLRPPLLPEDMRYIGSSSQLDAIRPSLETWLTQVFRVMGGYVIATGTLGLTLAATSFREHRSGAALGTLIAGVRPHRCIKIDLVPLSLAKLAGPNKHVRRQCQRKPR